MLLGQLDPGLHGDGEAGGCFVVGDMFMEESDLAGMLCFLMVEFNQFVVGGDGGVCGGDRGLGYGDRRGGVWCWRGLGDSGYGLRLHGVGCGMGGVVVGWNEAIS